MNGRTPWAICGLLLLACATRPEITTKQVEDDLVGRTVGEGLSAESFGKTAFRNNVIKRITVIEAKYDGSRATIVAEVQAEWQPPPMPSFAPRPTLPAPSWPPGVSPSTWVAPRKLARRLSLVWGAAPRPED